MNFSAFILQVQKLFGFGVCIMYYYGDCNRILINQAFR